MEFRATGAWGHFPVLLAFCVAWLLAPRAALAQCDGGFCPDVRDAATSDRGVFTDAAFPFCGDRACNNGETCATCSIDCGACPVPDASFPFCGDRACNNGETCATCSIDCGLCPVPDAGGPRCGDMVCGAGETCATCAIDCGACRVCGDGMCLGAETCSTCPIDCGMCAPGDAGAPVDVFTPRDAGVPVDVFTPSDAGAPVDVSSPDVRVLPDTPPPTDLGTTDTGTFFDAPRPTDVGIDTGPPDVPRPDAALDRPTTPDTPTGSDTGADVRDVPSSFDRPTDMGSPTDTGSPRDAGSPADSAVCTMPPMLLSTPPPIEVSYSWDSPGFFGIGVSYTFAISFSAASTAMDGMCMDSLSAGGSAEVCGKVFGNLACGAGSITGMGSCTMPQVCDMPPRFRCDRTRACCNASATVMATVSRGWYAERNVGPFECGFDVRGTVGASIAPGVEQGAGCMCQPRRLTLEGRVILGASGGGNCTISLFGARWGVGASAAVCANGGVRGAIGCGGSLSPVGGASFQINIPRVRIGWIEVAPTTFRRETGSGC